MDVLVFVIWITSMIVAGLLAPSRGRSSLRWILASLFLTPLSIIVLLALPNLRAQAQVAAMKSCPQCAEMVQPSAILCRFCRFEFSARADEILTAPEESSPIAAAKPARVVLGVLLFAFVAIAIDLTLPSFLGRWEMGQHAGERESSGP